LQLSSGRNVLCMLFALLITQTILANGHVALNFPLPWQIFTREVLLFPAFLQQTHGHGRRVKAPGVYLCI
jgi:hypothetical protein